MNSTRRTRPRGSRKAATGPLVEKADLELVDSYDRALQATEKECLRIMDDLLSELSSREPGMALQLRLLNNAIGMVLRSSQIATMKLAAMALGRLNQPNLQEEMKTLQGIQLMIATEFSQSSRGEPHD